MFNQNYSWFMSLCIIFLFGALTAYSFSPSLTLKTIPTICSYCLCDEHSSTVICTRPNILIKTVNLPIWAETFHAHNLTMKQFPHFDYHPGLKVLRINHCQLSEIHPLAFIPLPNLESVHLADNLLNSIPETLFRRLSQLRILNLARNRIESFERLEWDFPQGLVLDQLILDGNPFKLGNGKQFSWPLTKQLHMANMNIESLYADKIVFHTSPLCSDPLYPECRTLNFGPELWTKLKVLDISNNGNMTFGVSALRKLSNATTLKLNHVRLPENFIEWLSANGAIRHLELRRASFGYPIQEWDKCPPTLEWLDLSEIGISSLKIQEICRIRWLYALDNRISTLNIDAKSLKAIYLDRNRLKSWPFESENNSQLANLEVLSIKENLMDTLPAMALQRFPLLETLDLSGNLIARIEPDAFPTVGMSLQYVNMSGNRLKNFGHPILPSLVVLDLSKNLLNNMDNKLLSGMPSLQHLHLSNNFNLLSNCHSGNCWLDVGLVNLVEIDFSGCQIKKQPDLSNFVNLRALSLNTNSITQIDGGRLPPCVGHLNLRWNQIHALDNFTDAQLNCLKDLDLGHNPLKCDCSLINFFEILSFQPDLTDQNTYYCFTELLHPLNMYLETTTTSCENNSSIAILPILLNVITILLTTFAIGFLVVLFFVQVRRYVNFGGVQFLYRPVPTDAPTAL